MMINNISRIINSILAFGSNLANPYEGIITMQYSNAATKFVGEYSAIQYSTHVNGALHRDTMLVTINISLVVDVAVNNNEILFAANPYRKQIALCAVSIWNANTITINSITLRFGYSSCSNFANPHGDSR